MRSYEELFRGLHTVGADTILTQVAVNDLSAASTISSKAIAYREGQSTSAPWVKISSAPTGMRWGWTVRRANVAIHLQTFFVTNYSGLWPFFCWA
jgi:hypothetical protein